MQFNIGVDFCNHDSYKIMNEEYFDIDIPIN